MPDQDHPLTTTNQIELIIPARDGVIAWKDVAASLADTLKLDSPTVERIFPTGSIDLHSGATILTIFGINLAMGDAMSIAMVDDADGQPAIRLLCNRESIGFLSPKHESKPAEIHLDEDWNQRTANKPLVMCLHGLKSSPAKFDRFRSFLRQSGYATAALSYDDHQSIVKSAEQLSEIASKLFVAPNQPELVLIGHSMGGLVAREWTENPKLGNDQITHLITAGTPHRGSNWASLPPLLDFFAKGQLDSGDLIDVILHQPSAPGIKELAPESAFLTKLGSRPRVPGIRYTTIVGTHSPLTENESTKLRKALQRIDEKSTAMRLIRPRIQPLLQSFEELARGKGDGVVAVDRATIKGVDDIVKVPLSHVDLFDAPSRDKQPVWDAILQRLQRL